ncbi:MAG TPA: DUF4367 domain-containing protein [Candidatus Saccharimonadales bacterium]|nr:DUF4367 domain-containing protein [Candidatus Saccharimonadales bacterium]
MDNYPSSIDTNYLAKGQVINAIKSATRVKNQVIDGFVKATDAPTSLKNNSQRLATGARHLHQRAEKTQTLMRGAIKKPTSSLSSRVQRLTPGANPEREIRARKIPKHSLVDRFGAPVSNFKPRSKPQSRPTLQGEIVSRPAANAAVAAATPVLPSMVASASHQRLERLLDEALTKADAHKQALKYQSARHFWQRPGFMGRHKGIKLSALFLVIIVGGLFLAWQKLPQLSVKVAAARAHVSASIPSYKPDGYQVAAPASAQAGAVVIKYKAPDSGGFDLTQQNSDMTSNGVAQTVVPQNTQVQTTHVDGNTVYIYGSNNNAAWVNNGVLYKIDDHSRLSSDEIINIVKGLN